MSVVPVIRSGQFYQARWKLERAKRHIQEIQSQLGAFLNSDFCKFHIEPELHTGDYLVKLDSISALPVSIPLGIGDTAHNLRTALDYVTSYVVGGGERISFPIAKTRDDLRQKGRAWDKLKQGIHAALADLILDNIEPYSGGRFKLWEIAQLDNTDKHALLVPALSIQQITVSFVNEKYGLVFEDMTMAVSDGRAVTVARLPPPVKITRYGKPTADIFFGDGTVFEGQPVIPTLIDCLNGTLEAIKALELFCLRTFPDGNASQGVS